MAGASGVLLGVPVGVKDSYLTKGFRRTLGISNLKTFEPTRDAGAVGVVKNAGTIPECALETKDPAAAVVAGSQQRSKFNNLSGLLRWAQVEISSRPHCDLCTSYDRISA